MSDKSGYSSSNEEHSDDQNQYSDEDRDDHSDREDGEASESHEAESDKEPVDLSKVTLCSVHKAGEMTVDCQYCSASLKLIRDKDTIKQLTANAGKSGVVSRYSGRCDDTQVSLHLDQSTIQIAHDIFTKGTFKDRKAWHDIIKNFLTLPAAQHEMLCQDIRAEDVLNKFKREKRWKNLFRYNQELLDCLKTLRIAQRPLLKLIETTNDSIDNTRKIAADAGIILSDNPPNREGDNVPRGGRKVTDQFHVASCSDMFQRPDIGDLCTQGDFSQEQAKLIVDYIESYRDSVAKQFLQLYNSTAGFINEVDDQLIFYSDIYSHTDGTFRDLIRTRVANIFKLDVKTDVLAQTSHRNLSEKPSGLLGGQFCYIIN